MAATLVTTIKRFTGTSAERVALSVVGVPAGSTYFDDEEGILYVLSKAGTWGPKKSPLSEGAATEATLVEIKVFDGGTATGGSKTTIVDTGKDWETNMFAGNVAKITVGTKDYYRTVASNTANTLTIATLPGAAASAIIGTPGTAEVTITVVAEGVGGNSYTAEVVEAPGDDDNLSASLTGTVLTVYLGKTGGALDNAKNTAILVAAAIDAIPEFTAAMTGSGGVVAAMEAVPFTGGVAVVDVTAGSEYQIMRKVVVSDGGSSITVDQSTHDNLNLNANLQVGNADVAAANPIPTTLTGSRGSVIAHRTAITVADKVPVVTITAADSSTAGSLTAVAHGIGVAPGNSYGSAGVSALVTVTPTVDKSIDITIPQATGATYYDIFLSTSTTAPLWVARVTEEQRVTGCVITAVGTVDEGGSAGVVNVQIIGTESASTAAPFVANNAYIPTGITAIPCAGKTKAYIHIDFTVTDLRSLPAIEINPFMQNNDSGSTLWFQIESQAIAVMNGATGQPLPQVFVVDVNSARNFIVLIGAISGQGASVNITVELF